MNNELPTNNQPILSETPVIDGMQANAPVTGPTRQRVIRTLDWLVADTKHRFDDCKNNLDAGSSGPSTMLGTGGYSPELTEAIDLLDALKKGVRCHDEDTLAAAYRKGFEDAGNQILEKVRALLKS